MIFLTRLSLLAAVVGVAAALLVVTDAGTPVRPFVVVPFLLAGPGVAIVGLLGLSDALEAVMLAIAVSVSLDTLLALGMLYGGFWSPGLGVSILAGIAVLAALLSSVRPPRAISPPR